MPQLSIAAPGLEPNPKIVMQLLRAIGGKVRLIADALTRNAPLLEEEFPDRPEIAQLTRLRQLLAVLAAAESRPRILYDGREIQGRTLHDLIEAGEKMQFRSAPGP